MAQRQDRHEVTPVVFIHGTWLHASSWDAWVKLFRRLGYETMAPGWPGEPDELEEARLLPEQVAGFGVDEVTEHFAKKIEVLDKKPVVIGHSFGGLVAQKLLGMDLAAAAITISPAQPQGVWRLPLRQLAAAWPALRNPFNFRGSVALTAEEFRYGFGNAISREESTELYTRWTVPSPTRPLWQAAFANVSSQATKVDVANAKRGPLLLIAGKRDNTVPASVVRSQFSLYTRSSEAVTEIQEFENRGHSLHLDGGWREIADATIRWLKVRVH